MPHRRAITAQTGPDSEGRNGKRKERVGDGGRRQHRQQQQASGEAAKSSRRQQEVAAASSEQQAASTLFCQTDGRRLIRNPQGRRNEGFEFLISKFWPDVKP